MRALVALTIVMGVLIVIGTATVAVTIFHRVGNSAKRFASGQLDEPVGTHIVSASAYGDKLAVVLQGGGPDRVVVFDPGRGTVTGRVALTK